MDSIPRSHLQRVVVGNEKNVKDCRGRKIPSQETAGVRKDCLGVDDRQTEEGDGPHPVENLKQNKIKPISTNAAMSSMPRLILILIF